MKRVSLSLVLLFGCFYGVEAVALSFEGAVGLGYTNWLLKRPQQPYAPMHILLQDYHLRLGAVPFRRGYLAFNASGRYSNQDNRRPDGRFSAKNLSGQANLGLLQESATPIRLHLRRDRENTRTLIENSEFLGASHIFNYGGSLLFETPALPKFNFSLHRTERTVENAFGEQAREKQLVGDLRATHAMSNGSFDILGRSIQSRGSLLAAAYASDYVTLTQTGKFDDDTQFTARGAIFRRIPLRKTDFNPGFLQSNVNLNLRRRHDEQWLTSYHYSYGRLGRTELTADNLQAHNHQGGARAFYKYDPQWTVFGGATVSRQRYRSDTQDARGWSEFGDLGVQMLKPLAIGTVNSEITALGGHTQPESGRGGYLYGVGADVSLAPDLDERLQTAARLSGDWRRDESAIGGREYNAALHLTAASTAIRDTRAALSLALAHHWRRQKQSGRSSHTSFTADINVAWRRWLTGQLGARYQNGLSRHVQSPIDPLVLPDSYNVVSRSYSATFGYLPWPNLHFKLNVQALFTRSGELEQHYNMLELRADYHIGKLTVSVWDRLVHERSGDRGIASNMFYVLVTRRFGVHL